MTTSATPWTVSYISPPTVACVIWVVASEVRDGFLVGWLEIQDLTVFVLVHACVCVCCFFLQLRLRHTDNMLEVAQKDLEDAENSKRHLEVGGVGLEVPLFIMLNSKGIEG